MLGEKADVSEELELLVCVIGMLTWFQTREMVLFVDDMTTWNLQVFNAFFLTKEGRLKSWW